MTNINFESATDCSTHMIASYIPSREKLQCRIFCVVLRSKEYKATTPIAYLG